MVFEIVNIAISARLCYCICSPIDLVQNQNQISFISHRISIVKRNFHRMQKNTRQRSALCVQPSHQFPDTTLQIVMETTQQEIIDNDDCDEEWPSEDKDQVTGMEDKAVQAESLQDEEAQVSQVWRDFIPEEILLEIFKEGTRRYGPVPFLCRTAQVCRRWYELSYHASLWTEVDLSIGWIHRDLTGLRTLCETRLHKTTCLDLTAWFAMNDQCLKCIIEHCKKLQVLRLAHCEKLTPAGMLHLTSSDVPLQELDLSFVSPLVTIHKCLCRLIQNIGSTLRVLTLAGNYMDDHMDAVLSDIMTYCSGLTHLDLSNLNDALITHSAIILDIEALQHSCHNLQVLILAGSVFKVKANDERTKAFAPGFPKLQKFRAPSTMNDDFLQRTLKSSFDLENLEMKLEGRLTGEIHCSRLPITSLLKLTIWKALPQHIPIRWHDSLVYLDLSWLSSTDREHSVDSLMRRLFHTTGPMFRVLHTILLCGCPLSTNGVRPMITCCPALNHLNLNFCPMLPYGWSREYQGVELTIFKHVMLGLPNLHPPLQAE